ncbi:CTP synthase [Ktedonobacteria bacterium brp13]|nr:CTP synthase [Ktedonobacteria bacterium brp13]
MSKFIFVTGGVASSVGKGISVASIGRLLKNRGVSVTLMKLDPYINVDPGTMSPYQHGEVFVTDDGAETDLDLGHYERFTDEPASQANNLTTGQVYASVIAKERRGEYLGGTIQVIPHITNEIKDRIHAVARRTDADVVIVEVGGTVGDIEGEPYLEAIRQMRKDVGRHNVLYIHVTLLPYLGAAKELKTKPTQHSVKELLRVGIQPDVILCRSDYVVSDDMREKIALFCNIDANAVIGMTNAETIYEVPLNLEEAGLGEYLVQELSLPRQQPEMEEWGKLVAKIKSPRPELTIGLVGKYVELHDAYLSVVESLHHAGWFHNVDIRIKWINSEALEQMGDNYEEALEDVAGIVIPGGFGHRGIEGKIKAAGYARRNNIPYLGLCLGMQVAVIEFARNVLGMTNANSSEFDAQTPDPVIDLMHTQRSISDKGGTMRLGSWVCCLMPGTKTHQAYGEPIVFERHRHRYEFNNEYRKRMELHGLVVSGRSADNSLVEVIEVKDHPFFVASQFHPEFKSRPNRSHPLFRDFVGASVKLLHNEQKQDTVQELEASKVLQDSRVEL